MAFTFKHGDRPLEGYVIQRGVGTGGFGEVYYAVSDGGREVALKYLRDNPAVELRGVSHCMNLKSPHLVTIFDVKQNADGDYFIIMEYVQGPSLRDLLIAEPDGLGPQKAAFFIRELAKGLGYLHERGIVHRDMKPGNIFYEDGYVKIGDYGLSKFISVSRHSAQTASIGTVHYMAPEIGSGHYHRGIDIYALGVILYEMLLGRVPYDGATMGEVLMKHLTAQPEVDELPAPFSRVIRNALEKDPKDRYQTVDEMSEEILDVNEIQKSLAGFNPQSLSAVARVGREPLRTPSPSPNPPRVPPRGIRIGRQAARGGVRAHVFRAQAPSIELSGKLAKRMNRISDKISRKMQQLDRKHGRRRPQRKAAPNPFAAIDRGRLKQSAVAILLAVGIAAGLAILAGITGGEFELAASAGLGVMMMSAGVVASRKATSWLGQAGHPTWVQRAVTLGCCAPLLAIAMAPTMAASKWVPETGVHGWPAYRSLYPEAAMALLALIITAMLVDWDKRLQLGAAGEMKVGQAFTAGLCALIFTAVFTEGSEGLTFLAAGIAAATSITVQGVAWFAPPRGLAHRTRSGDGPDQAAGAPPDPVTSMAEAKLNKVSKRLGKIGKRVSYACEEIVASPHRRARAPKGDPEIPMAIPVEQDSLHARLATTDPLPPVRHTVARAFWSVVSFALLAGAVVSFLSTLLLGDFILDDLQAVVTACVACCCMLVFALRKTTVRKRPTFWQETLRPFLLSLIAIGIGAPIVALAVQPRLEDELKLFSVSAIVLCGVLFLILLIARRRHAPVPFLLDPGDVTPAAPIADATQGHGVSDKQPQPLNEDQRAETPAS